MDLHTRVGVFVAVHKEEFPISHQQIIIRAKRYLGTGFLFAALPLPIPWTVHHIAANALLTTAGPVLAGLALGPYVWWQCHPSG